MENKVMLQVLKELPKAVLKGALMIFCKKYVGDFEPLIEELMKAMEPLTEPKEQNDLIAAFGEEHFPEAGDEKLSELYDAAEKCINQIDFVKDYDADLYVKEIAEEFLEENRYDEEAFLKKALPAFLSHLIKYIREEKEGSTQFRIDFKLCIREKIKELEYIAANHEVRLENLERKDRVCGVYDSTEDFRDIYSAPARLDREKDKEVLLKDIYVVPDYTVPEKDNSRHTDLEEKLKSWLNNGNDLKKRFLTVFGEPGIGKSSLISYLLGSGRFKLPAKKYCFKFSDIQCIKKYTTIGRLPSEILNEFNMKKEDLNDTLLILDGLDEVNLGDGGQAELIQEIFNQWTQREDIKNFCILFTCRTARLNKTELKKLKSDCIILEPFSSEQVLKFIEKYTKARNKVQNPLNEESVSAITEICKQFDKNEIGDESYAVNENYVNEIFQIPLILYMVLALDIKVESNADMLSIYDQIFSIEGENSIYNHGKKTDRDFKTIKKEERKKIHEFSQDAAIKMWELHPQKAVLSEKEYTAIVGEEGDIHKLFSGQYFVEGAEGQELYFIHRSIYEYFVAVRYYAKLKRFLEKISDIKECYDREKCIIDFIKLASVASMNDDINYEILMFVLKFCKEDNIVLEENDIFCFFDSLFEDRILLSLSKDDKGRLEKYNWESKIFGNISFILTKVVISLDASQKTFKLLPEKCVQYYFMYKDEYRDLTQLNFKGYRLNSINLGNSVLRYSNFQESNLSEANLKDTDLRESHLECAVLREANLERANLRGAHLEKTNFEGAYLEGVNLSGTYLEGTNLEAEDLREVNLEGANLREANLGGANLAGANLKGADLEGAHLEGINLEGANLEGANLKSATVDDFGLMEITINVKNAVINSKTMIDVEFKKYMLEHGAVYKE